MKTFNIKILAFYVIFCLHIASCCKDKNPYLEGCQDKAPEEMGDFNLDTVKPYIYFKEGSWWVYENDSTLELDSIVVTSSDDRILQANGEKRRYTYESVAVSFKSYLNNYDIRFFNTGSNPDMVNWSFYLFWQRDRSKPGDFEGPIVVFSTFADTGMVIQAETTYKGILDSMNLSGVWYYNVKVYEVKGDPTWPDSKIPTNDFGTSTYYYAKNIGLIAIKNIDSDNRYNDGRWITQTWKLKKYFIKN
jgi:hypothetical protein